MDKVDVVDDDPVTEHSNSDKSNEITQVSQVFKPGVVNAFTLMMNDDTRLKTSGMSKKRKKLPPKSKTRKK